MKESNDESAERLKRLCVGCNDLPQRHPVLEQHHEYRR